jgi:hypothetical protein
MLSVSIAPLYYCNIIAFYARKALPEGSTMKKIRHACLMDEVTAPSWHPEHRGLLGGDASGNVCFWEVS